MSSGQASGIGQYREKVGTQPPEGQQLAVSIVMHAVGWVVLAGLTTLGVLDQSLPATGPGDGALSLSYVGALTVGFVVWLGFGLWVLLRRWEGMPVTWVVSRSLLLFGFLVILLTAMLDVSRDWGVRIEACRGAVCSGVAVGRDVLGLLAWNAADVVPGLDIPGSLGWTRPARSSSPLVGLSIILVRLWVLVGVLGVLARLWTAWTRRQSTPGSATGELGDDRGEPVDGVQADDRVRRPELLAPAEQFLDRRGGVAGEDQE